MNPDLSFPVIQAETMPFLEELFLTHGKQVHFKKNNIIYDYWDELKYIYYLVKGAGLYLQNTVKGNDRTLGVVLPGSSFGECEGLLNINAKSRFETIEDSEILTIPVLLLRQMLKDDHELTLNLFMYLHERQLDFRNVTSYFSEVNVPQRFALFLKAYAKRSYHDSTEGWLTCRIKITMERLGEIISANRVTVTALINFLIKEGLLRKNGAYLDFSTDIIRSDFIKSELAKSRWCSLKNKKVNNG